MRRLLAVVLLAAVRLSAAEQFVFAPPDESLITVRKAIPYSKTRAGDITFDVYTPKNASRAPVVIFANVGSPAYPGWPIYIGWGKAVATAGFAGVVYQATNDKTIENFDELMAHLRANAAELRVDPTRVIIWAGSSNVPVGLRLAMDPKRDYIRGATIFYGFSDMPAIRTDLPVLFVRSGVDVPSLNRNIDAMLQKVLAANAPWTIENHASGLHGFEVLNDNDVSRLVIARTLRFMNDVAAASMTAAYAANADDASLASAFANERWDVAIAGYGKRATSAPTGDNYLRLGLSLLGAKRYAEALPALEKAWESGRRGVRDTAYPAARAAAGANNIERTVHGLDVVLSSRFAPAIDEVRNAPDFAPVRDAAPFRDLLDSVEEERRIVNLIANSENHEEGMRLLEASQRSRFQREAVLNLMGYAVMNNHRYAGSAAIFELNTIRHPESANAWDSYSEALERLGKHAESLAAARKALQLATDPNLRAHAEARVKRLSAR